MFIRYQEERALSEFGVKLKVPGVMSSEDLYNLLVEDGSILPPIAASDVFKRTTRSTKRKLDSVESDSDDDSETDSLLEALDKSGVDGSKKCASKDCLVSEPVSGKEDSPVIQRQLTLINEKLDKLIEISSCQQRTIDQGCYLNFIIL